MHFSDKVTGKEHEQNQIMLINQLEKHNSCLVQHNGGLKSFSHLAIPLHYIGVVYNANVHSII